MQAMASLGDATAPIELKAVDAALADGRTAAAEGRAPGRRAAPKARPGSAKALAERLGVAPGGAITIGGQPLTVGGIIADEPDRLSEGLSLGTVAIVALATCRAAPG
ncbi:MAG: hypothetical protein QM756_20315 [Polyangiaceae bacterium]